MTHVFYIDDRKTSLTSGRELSTPATVIDAPPIMVCGIRLYAKNTRGLRTLTEVWTTPPEDLKRVISLPKRVDLSLIHI